MAEVTTKHVQPVTGDRNPRGDRNRDQQKPEAFPSGDTAPTIDPMTPTGARHLLDTATLPALLAALGPRPIEDGGTCPHGSHDAWAVDQLQYTCDHGHRGTLWTARRAVAEQPDALAHLLGQHRLAGAPLRPAVRRLPAIADDLAGPADIYAAWLAVAYRHDYDDQTTWLRAFWEHHGAQVAGPLILTTPDELKTPAIIDAVAGLRDQASGPSGTVAA